MVIEEIVIFPFSVREHEGFFSSVCKFGKNYYMRFCKLYLMGNILKNAMLCDQEFESYILKSPINIFSVTIGKKLAQCINLICY